MDKPKRVYIAGPLLDCGDGPWMRATASALLTASKDLAGGFVGPPVGGSIEVVIPDRKHSRDGVEDPDPKLIVRRDLADIRSCDAVLVRLHPVSAGAAMETMYAYERGLLVVGWYPKQTPGGWFASVWMHAHTHDICPTLGDACVTLVRELLG